MTTHTLDPTAPATTRHTPPSTPRSRISALDVVRGFALCGILLVNAPGLLKLEVLLPHGGVNPVHELLDVTVQQRFFPIFSILFGVGFGLMWATAQRRSTQPRLALARRLATLGVLGGLHQLLQPGEALLPYALAGLVFLLPATWLRGRAATVLPAVIGTALLVVGIATGGGLALIPGLFLLGYAVGLAGLLPRITASVKATTLVAAASIAAASAAFAVFGVEGLRIAQIPSAATGLAMAIAYVSVLLLLLHTPARGTLQALFAPLGRMALTNYLAATLALLAARLLAPSWGITGGSIEAWLRMLGVCAGVLTLQWVFSRAWLARYDQGPMERLWRLATWGRPRDRDARETAAAAAAAARRHTGV